MWLDGFTIQNLELFQPNQGGGTSTLEVIDSTVSPMGARMLRSWLSLPLLELKDISARQQTVEELLSNDFLRNTLRDTLKGLSDIERLCSRIATERISPKELARLSSALDAVELLVHEVSAHSLSLPESLPTLLPELRQRLQEALVEDPTAVLGKGQAIKSDFNMELAHLRGLLKDATSTLEDIRAREAEATGIPSLKLAFNNVFGYYLEVRNSHRDKVPENWHRKQTLINAERYITEELKKFEIEVLGAEDKIRSIESRLYQELVKYSNNFLAPLLEMARWTATLDVLSSFSQTALSYNYVRPSFVEGQNISIKEGRHPVIEQVLPQHQPYIANGIDMKSKEASIAMITGPNMSGKRPCYGR